jgi:glyoxylase-like metal-dependent hydrolase (beta-lactamase superfamily II)
MKLTKPMMGDPALAPGRHRRLEADGPTGVPGITALHTPGHTAGHLSYLLDAHSGVLFAGDVATNLSRADPSPAQAGHPRTCRRTEASMRKLAELEFRRRGVRPRQGGDRRRGEEVPRLHRDDVTI